jgi:hypothetical protein
MMMMTTSVSEKMTDIYVKSVRGKVNKKVTRLIFEAENLLVVTTGMVKVTGVHFNAATVSESVTDRAAVITNMPRVSRPKPNCCADPECQHID